MPYLRGEADVGRLARERHANIEAMARELRYRCFFSLVEQDRLDLVATAHTANDQAETVLMRLIRGTGTRGLGGIYPVLEGKVVRPFLTVRRDEIMQEIAARGISYRVDSTNLLPRLRRNKVRMELLPLLLKPDVLAQITYCLFFEKQRQQLHSNLIAAKARQEIRGIHPIRNASRRNFLHNFISPDG